MNIFYLDRDPKICSEYHADKHVVKMVLETAQILSTIQRLSGNTNPILYKISHKNHPSTIWARESQANYNWLYDLFCSLCDEYTYRYGKVHLSDTKLRGILANVPKLPIKDFVDPPQVVSDECKSITTVDAYRNYYNGPKSHLGKWTNRNIPEWFSVEGA